MNFIIARFSPFHHYLLSCPPSTQGLMAIWSPETGIVDWGRVTRSYGENFVKLGGKIHSNFRVVKFQKSDGGNEYPVVILSDKGKVRVGQVFVACDEGSLKSILTQ